MLLRILLVLLLPLLPLAGAAPAQASAADTYERQVVRATNAMRVDRGRRALRRQSCLARFANSHARRMASQRRLFHQDLRPVLRRCQMRHAAENVAFGYRTGRTTVTAGWMHSDTHRRNLLTRSHGRTAVGAARDSRGRWWTAQLLGRR